MAYSVRRNNRALIPGRDTHHPHRLRIWARGIALVVSVLTIFVSPVLHADSYQDGLRAFDAGQFQQAKEAWKKAALHHDEQSQFQLGQMYEIGTGVSRDLAEAHFWYSVAAARGLGDAERALTRIETEMSDEEFLSSQIQFSEFAAVYVGDRIDDAQSAEADSELQSRVLETDQTQTTTVAADSEDSQVSADQAVGSTQVETEPTSAVDSIDETIDTRDAADETDDAAPNSVQSASIATDPPAPEVATSQQIEGQAAIDDQSTYGNAAIDFAAECGQEIVIEHNAVLDGIAADYWPVLYAFNRDRIGNDPTQVAAGTKLRIPCLDPDGIAVAGQFPDLATLDNVAALQATPVPVQPDTPTSSDDISNAESSPAPQTQASPDSDSSASDIAGLQSKLTRLGYSVGEENGDVGPETLRAIRAFKRDNMLFVSDDVDTVLLQAINVAVQELTGG